MARFYIDGHETDIQEPFFHVDEQDYREITDSIEQLLTDYA